MNKLLIKPTEAAELLSIGRSVVYEMIAAGEIPSVRLGRSLRISAEALTAWVEAQSHRSETATADAKCADNGAAGNTAT